MNRRGEDQDTEPQDRKDAQNGTYTCPPDFLSKPPWEAAPAGTRLAPPRPPRAEVGSRRRSARLTKALAKSAAARKRPTPPRKTRNGQRKGGERTVEDLSDGRSRLLTSGLSRSSVTVVLLLSGGGSLLLSGSRGSGLGGSRGGDLGGGLGGRDGSRSVVVLCQFPNPDPQNVADAREKKRDGHKRQHAAL